MKRTLLFLLLFVMVVFTNAQVKDVSFTVSPNASFTWWNDKAGLDDSPGIGASVGFGFGEFVELKGIYMQSNDLKTSFTSYGLDNFNEELFQVQNVNLSRWGAEMRTNLGSKALTPYLVLGTGVQTIEVEDADKSKQIYAEAGAGFKVNFGHRTALSLEARNTAFKYNSVQNLLTDQNKTEFGINDADFSSETLDNWSVLASLQFYLGGTTPGSMSEIDQAYRSYYQHGFKGARWVFEPAVAHIDFDDASQFRNTYLIGLYTGVDFNEYVGIRGFYMRATQNNEINLGNDLFDDLSMYGGEFRAKFNSSIGITPYLTVGGGYIDPMNGYVPETGTEIDGDLFASGGVGILIPIGKSVELFGSGKMLLTSSADKELETTTDDILKHKMINVGVKFSLGKKSEKPGDALEREKSRIRESEQMTYEQKLAEMKLVYLEQIAELESELEEARISGDTIKATMIEADKRKAETTYAKLDPTYVKDTVQSSGEIIMRMTPEQFEKLIKTILEGAKELKPEVEKLKENQDSSATAKQTLLLEKMNSRLERLEDSLNILNKPQSVAIAPTSAALTSAEQPKLNDEVLDKLDKLQGDYQKLSEDISFLKGQSANAGQMPVVINSGQQKEEKEPMVVTQTVKADGSTEVEAHEISDLEAGTFDFAGLSPMAGFNLGGAFTFNLTARAHMPIHRSAFEFTPEFFLGFGSKSSWGAIGNVTYPMTMEKAKLKPYAGAGLGLWKIDGSTKLGLNLVGGTYFDLLDGKFFTDLSIRSFKHVQISAGYTFEF
ncbi:MAG: hypothetical protein ACK5M7_11170 [Draconibacterium sp.]